MEIELLGGASEGQTMTLVNGTTEICAIGPAHERQVYVKHLMTEYHSTRTAEVFRQGWFRLKQLSMMEGQARFRELHPHYSDG